MELLQKKLLEALRLEFRHLRREDDFAVAEEVLEKIAYGSTRRGTFFSCKQGGEEPVINPKHKVLQRFLTSEEKSKVDLYFLLSALYSILNRADPDIEDRHEREFHAKILEELLHGRSNGRWTEY